MRVSILGFGAACQTTKAFPGGFSEERKQGGNVVLCYLETARPFVV